MTHETLHLCFPSQQAMANAFDALGWFTDGDDGKQYSFSTTSVGCVVLGHMVRDDTPEGAEPVLSAGYHADVVVEEGELPEALKAYQVFPQHPRHRIGA